jgi:hypothetical protein
VTDAKRRIADHTGQRRTIDHIRQDVGSAARALRHHAEALGKLRQQSRTSREDKLALGDDVKAIAEYCEELERVIIKFFNAAIRKARKEVP